MVSADETRRSADSCSHHLSRPPCLTSTEITYLLKFTDISVYMMIQTWTSVLMNQSVINYVTTHREATSVPVTLGTHSTPLTDEPAQVNGKWLPII